MLGGSTREVVFQGTFYNCHWLGGGGVGGLYVAPTRQLSNFIDRGRLHMKESKVPDGIRTHNVEGQVILRLIALPRSFYKPTFVFGSTEMPIYQPMVALLKVWSNHRAILMFNKSRIYH